MICLRVTGLAFAAVLATPAAALDSEDCLILPGASVDLGGTVPGLIDEVLVEVGDEVREGDVVATLRSDMQEMMRRLAQVRAENRASITAAEAQLAFEEQEFARVQDLYERNVVPEAQVREREALLIRSRSELDDALSRVREAELEIERADVELEVRRIRATLDGVVSERFLERGEYLRDNGHVVTLVQLDPLRVEVFLTQAAYPSISVGDVVPVVPELGAPGPFDAVVASINPVIDAASATFGLRLHLPNPEGAIISGIRCTARFGDVVPEDG
ncbi:efflux RND transporter periplasmic adaptor subunit [Rhodosalinus sp. 5P4]|uniref:efflux RND transporter periplasmic adaptor subunit n=1 Tax=Rhodosalinus sp. 5P4 TaxID=3239196 RepID=UPI003526B0BD